MALECEGARVRRVGSVPAGERIDGGLGVRRVVGEDGDLYPVGDV